MNRRFQFLFGSACAAALLVALYHGYEGWFYHIPIIIHHPESLPVFGRRILFPAIARILPFGSDYERFFLLQFAIIGATLYLAGRWTEMLIPRGAAIGYALTTMMLAPAITYWNFYDIAIVGFWTLCLLLLANNRWGWYLGVLPLAILNHENALLLLPIATVYAFRCLRGRALFGFASAQIAAFLLVRYGQTYIISSRSWDWRLGKNLAFWHSYWHAELLMAVLATVPWWLLAAMCWRDCTRLIRCAWLAWPGLFAVTALFGQVNEARQWDAFIPVCVGAIACGIRTIWWWTPPGVPDDEAAHLDAEVLG